MFVFDDLLKVNYSHNGEEIGDFTILFVNKNPLCEWQSLTRRCNFHHQCTNLLYYKADILMLIASYHDLEVPRDQVLFNQQINLGTVAATSVWV